MESDNNNPSMPSETHMLKLLEGKLISLHRNDLSAAVDKAVKEAQRDFVENVTENLLPSPFTEGHHTKVKNGAYTLDVATHPVPTLFWTLPFFFKEVAALVLPPNITSQQRPAPQLFNYKMFYVYRDYNNQTSYLDFTHFFQKLYMRDSTASHAGFLDRFRKIHELTNYMHVCSHDTPFKSANDKNFFVLVLVDPDTQKPLINVRLCLLAPDFH